MVTTSDLKPEKVMEREALIAEKGADKCEKEIKLCNAFSDQAWRRIRRNLLMVDKNLDREMKDISEFVIEVEQYPFAV